MLLRDTVSASLKPPIVEAFRKTTTLLARRHEALVSTLDSEPKPPAFVAELPSIDLFVQSEAVRAITPHGEPAAHA